MPPTSEGIVSLGMNDLEQNFQLKKDTCNSSGACGLRYMSPYLANLVQFHRTESFDGKHHSDSDKMLKHEFKNYLMRQ